MNLSSNPVKLAGFVIGLAAAFGGAFALGAATDPIIPSGTTPSRSATAPPHGAGTSPAPARSAQPHSPPSESS